jgi:hypothetical protein
MADAYGEITFSTSDDCVINPEQLVNALNSHQCDNTGSFWACEQQPERTALVCKGGMFKLQYPTIFPQRIVAYHVGDSSGRDGLIPASDMTEEDYDCIYASRSEPVPLSELALDLSTGICSGWIELSCIANEKTRYVYFETLRVYSDGRAMRSRTVKGPVDYLPDAFETFDPTRELTGDVASPVEATEDDLLGSFQSNVPFLGELA